MKHILSMGTLLGMAVVIVSSGCATTGRGASDSDQIDALVGQWKEAILAKDVDMLMDTYSENFAHNGYDYDAADKAGLRAFIEGAIEQGSFDNVEVSMDGAKIAIGEGTATVYPITYTNWEGSVTIGQTLTKERTGWLITDMRIEGM